MAVHDTSGAHQYVYEEAVVWQRVSFGSMWRMCRRQRRSRRTGCSKKQSWPLEHNNHCGRFAAAQSDAVHLAA